jgi:cell division protein YceG involved in septum cleavage
MNDLKKIFEKSENKALSVVGFISKHRIVITIFVICFAVLVAVMQAQSYLNPERNEDKYIEIKSTISTRQIDQEIVEKLRKTQVDREESAESDFVDDRTNPFAE